MAAVNSRSSRAKVWVRTRPTANFAHGMINFHPDGKSLSIHCDRDPKQGYINNQLSDWSFKLDAVLHNACQETVYATTTADVVTAALDGFNGTILAYGQTGAGKTFTMTGATETYQQRGLIPRAISQLFKEIDERTDFAINVRVSYLEIYNETMSDLLSTLPESAKAPLINPLQIVEDEQGVYVRGLQCHLAQNEEDALNMLFEGEINRAIAAHTLNKQSSRSHCIFTLYIETRSRVESNAKYTQSKLNFVDLAGSERLGKTQSEGKTKEEAMYINKSLSFLEQVVLALADRRREHYPFRQSKLTHYLKDSIGGNCNTCLIANIWAEAAQIEETISTLKFATRMMCIAVEPSVNFHYNPAIMVKNLEKELTLLKRELAMHDTLANRSQVTYDPLTEQQRYEIRQQVRAYLDGNSADIDIVSLRQIQAVFEAFRECSSQMAKEIEERLRSRYTLLDKTDPVAIAAAQQAGLPVNDDGELVGDLDSRGFNVGPTVAGKPAPSAVVNAKKTKKTRGKEKQSMSPKSGSPLLSTKTPAMEAAAQITTPSGDKDDKQEDNGTPLHAREQQLQRPSTPPPRTQAFEEFKRDAGSEINRILTENKDILANKKKAYSDVAKLINCTKDEMDKSLAKLHRLREAREAEGKTVNEDGDIVITEEEYLEINRVKDLKAVYKSNYEELRKLKTEVQYCQKLVDQCRQRLIQEFDSWYEETYLGGVQVPADPQTTAGQRSAAGDLRVSGACVPMEDDEEQFDRRQKALLMADPESAAFYNAQMRTQKRRIYESAADQQHGVRRQPGTPTRAVRSQPPALLQVQY